MSDSQTVDKVSNGLFSRVNLATTNSDWSFALPQGPQPCGAVQPPTPVAMPEPIGSVASTSAATPARSGLLSFFYRGTEAKPAAAVPQPPAALGAVSPSGLLPVDACVDVDSMQGKHHTVEVTLPTELHRERQPGPLSIGADSTWNAFGSLPIKKKNLYAPASIDAVPVKAPAPLWSDLPTAAALPIGAPRTVPTLDAFRRADALPTAPKYSFNNAAVHAPRPISSSPTRSESDDEGRFPTEAPPLVPRMTPLKPVGEDSPELPRSPAAQPISAPSSKIAFNRSIAEPEAQKAENREEASKKNFLNTLFNSNDGMSEAVQFDAMEVATNRPAHANPKSAYQPSSFNTFFNFNLFNDASSTIASNNANANGTEETMPMSPNNLFAESEDSLERLKQIVGIVMQGVKVDASVASASDKSNVNSRFAESNCLFQTHTL